MTATLDFYSYTPHRAQVLEGSVRWVETGPGALQLPFLQLDRDPWREANAWFVDRATTRLVKPGTVARQAFALLRYAKWLLSEGVDWRHFPTRKADRCLVRFRGYLISERNAGGLAPSTASQIMRSVLVFYKWAYAAGLLPTADRPWQTKLSTHTYTTAFGLSRTVGVVSSDLAIPNRRPISSSTQGLHPLNATQRDETLEFSGRHSTVELDLFLQVGFFTGMRVETIAGLRTRSLENAVRHAFAREVHQVAVGPGANPAVPTKFDVTGSVSIPTDLLEALLDYVVSNRRLKRAGKAGARDADRVFLTAFGNPYVERKGANTPAINSAMSGFRRDASAAGLHFLQSFYFHQTRATFATLLAQAAVERFGELAAVSIVREALLQRDDTSAMRYIRYLVDATNLAAASDAYAAYLLGSARTL